MFFCTTLEPIFRGSCVYATMLFVCYFLTLFFAGEFLWYYLSFYKKKYICLFKNLPKGEIVRSLVGFFFLKKKKKEYFFIKN